MEPFLPGILRHGYSVHCAECCVGQYLLGDNSKAAAADAKRRGWKFDRNRGYTWYCQSCDPPSPEFDCLPLEIKLGTYVMYDAPNDLGSIEGYVINFNDEVVIIASSNTTQLQIHNVNRCAIRAARR